MKTFRKILIGLLVALMVGIPLGIAATATNPTAQRNVVRIANQPTPTPTQIGAPCNGQGC